MRRAAIGIRAHSGWGALISLTENSSKLEVLDRKRIDIVDPGMAGAGQPYHFARGQKQAAAEKFLASCAAISGRLAFAALDEVVRELGDRDYAVAGCAILLASGRSLPPLEQVLASHPLIHTAEGEFFRSAFRRAAERLKIPVTGIRERDLETRAEEVFGGGASRLRGDIAALAGELGPPWTTDQKSASLAACLVLAAPPKFP